MLIAHYLFSMLRAWMGSHHPAGGAGATGTPSGQPQQPGTVAEPAAPVAQPLTSTPTETTQIGLVIESALGASTGTSVGSQATPGAAGTGAGEAAAAGAGAAGKPSESAAPGANAALDGLSAALGHAGTAQALSVIAAQIAARQAGTAEDPLPAFDDADLAALAALASGPQDAEAEARALAEDSVLRHRREEWLARITEAAGSGGAGAPSGSEEAVARDAAGAIFAALFGAAGASAPAQIASAAAHRGYGAARTLFG